MRPSWWINPLSAREHAQLERRIEDFNKPRPGERLAPSDFVGDDAREPAAFVPCNWQEGDPF